MNERENKKRVRTPQENEMKREKIIHTTQINLAGTAVGKTWKSLFERTKSHIYDGKGGQFIGKDEAGEFGGKGSSEKAEQPKRFF